MMQDAIGNDLEIGDYVACVIGDWGLTTSIWAR